MALLIAGRTWSLANQYYESTQLVLLSLSPQHNERFPTVDAEPLLKDKECSINYDTPIPPRFKSESLTPCSSPALNTSRDSQNPQNSKYTTHPISKL
jgi:hypothetical protein